MQNAFKNGVLHSISSPSAYGMISGHAVIFRTGAELYDEAIVKRASGLFVLVAHFAKGILVFQPSQLSII